MILKQGWSATQQELRAFNPLLAWENHVGSTRRSLLWLAADNRRRGDNRKFAAKALAAVRQSRPALSRPTLIAPLWREFFASRQGLLDT